MKDCKLFKKSDLKYQILDYLCTSVAVFFLQCQPSMANSYDLCKDILRDGVRDQISTRDSLDHKLAAHKEFCSISKEYNLNESNFTEFASDYAKKVKAHQSGFGVGASVGYGPFSFGGNYSQSNSGSELSENDKKSLLINNKNSVIDYFKQNCGQESYEESLKTEAVLLSSIANTAVVEAWKECMLAKTQSGFFVEVQRVGGNDREIDYHLHVYWKSEDNVRIRNLKIQYKDAKATSAYEVETSVGQWNTTVDICNQWGCLMPGGGLTLALTHTDLNSDASVALLAKTNTGVVKSYAIIFPARRAPESVALPNSVTPNPPVPTVHTDAKWSLCEKVRQAAWKAGLVTDKALLDMARNRNMVPNIETDHYGKMYIEGWYRSIDVLEQ